MARNREETMELIRNLLRKAESTNSQPEADTFFAKAQQFMTELSIDEETLWNLDPTKRSKIAHSIFNIPDKQAGAMKLRTLLNHIAGLNSCRVFYTPGVAQTTLVGYDNDRIMCEMLFSSIVTQMNFKMALASAVSTEHHKVFKTNFITAFVGRICIRLTEFYHTALKELDAGKTGSTALVLRSRKSLVDQHMQDTYGRMRSRAASSNGRYSSSARAAGTRAANETDLSTARSKLGGQRRLNS